MPTGTLEKRSGGEICAPSAVKRAGMAPSWAKASLATPSVSGAARRDTSRLPDLLDRQWRRNVWGTKPATWYQPRGNCMLRESMGVENCSEVEVKG